MNDAWSSERLAIVGSVLTRYSAYLEPGDRIKLGMEGDPCGTFRSVDDAPTAVVQEVRRDSASGSVHFTAKLEGSGEAIELNNHSVRPEDLWEIDPDYIEAFKERVFQSTQDEADAQVHESADHGTQDATDAERYRSVVNGRLASLEDELSRIQQAEREFRSTMTEVVSELARDLMRSSSGEEVQFAPKYVKRFDQAMDTDEASSHPDLRHDLPEDPTFMGSAGARQEEDKKDKEGDMQEEGQKRRYEGSDADMHQDEKYVFDAVTPLDYHRDMSEPRYDD